MKGSTVIFIPLGVALIGGLIWYFVTRKKAPETTVDADGQLQGCIKPERIPAKFQKWTDAFSGVDWGGYATSIRKWLPDYADEESGHYIAGFFKAIDVEPTGDGVKYFQDDIKEWMKSKTSLKHWNVTKGTMVCGFIKV